MPANGCFFSGDHVACALDREKYVTFVLSKLTTCRSEVRFYLNGQLQSCVVSNPELQKTELYATMIIIANDRHGAVEVNLLRSCHFDPYQQP